MKASFAHLPLSDFEGRLARKLRFHIFHFTFWGWSRTKALFSHLPLSDCEGRLARKLLFQSPLTLQGVTQVTPIF